MSGAMREKTQADFDLERFIDMFDEAMTSKDPRVLETLRSLMMIVAMTRPEDSDHFTERKTGPMRQMYDDIRVAHRRISDLEDMFKMMSRQAQPEGSRKWPEPEDIYKMKAAAQMAQSIDDDVMKNLARKINSPGLNLAQPKGLLKK